MLFRSTGARRPRVLLVFPLVLALLFASTITAWPLRAAPTSTAPMGLHVTGTQLVDGQGRPVRLLGVNRSGTEYACIQGWGIFDGPSDAASVQAIAAWHATAVRIPLNEDCWLAINGAPAAYAGTTYQQAIQDYVALLNQYGLAAILELHWSAAGSAPATDQQPMPNRDHSLVFWRSVATAFKDNGAVLFDLFNEPYPDNNQDTPAAWDCWQQGTTATNRATCPGSGYTYQAAGMQELVAAVRDTGARNVILLGGVQYANALAGWLAHRPADPANNLAAAWHVYNFNVCNNAACYDSTAGPVAAAVPLVTTEIGENDCGHSFIDPLMAWLDTHGAGYLAWTWDTWGGCGPVLISRYDGTSTAYGQGFRDHLAAIAAAPAAAPGGASPVISRNVPAYASGGYPAGYANDDDYATAWRSLAVPTTAAPQWLAYDISAIPAARRASVLAVWYNDATSAYWQGNDGAYYGQPRDYTIEANAAAGGALPADGWQTLVSVTGNTYASRAQTLTLTGYNWLRLRVTATNGGAGNADVAVQFDLQDLSAGGNRWLFLGDSITAEGLRHISGTGAGWAGGDLAQLASAATNGARFPTIVNGGVGGTTMAWAAQHVDDLLAPFAGDYVAISYGTNDANTAGPLSSSQVVSYYQHLLAVVDAVQARGMVAVVGTIPWGCAGDGWLGINARTLNDYVAAHLWTDRPDVVKGPDLWTFYQQHPDLLRDCIHPTYELGAGALNGYEQYQRQWLNTIVAVSGSANPASAASPTAATAPPPVAASGEAPAARAPLAPAAGTLVIYDNGLQHGFTDGSFSASARNACDTSDAVSAPCSYAISYLAWGGLNFVAPAAGLDTGPYTRLEWVVNTHGQPVTNFSVLFTDNTAARTVLHEVILSPANVVATLPNGWLRVSVPVADLNPAHAVVGSVQLKNATAGPLASINVDDVQLVTP
ncbi:MAG: cellulase family glycosylhydrolase [Thermomicrobiales bacterium]